MFARRDTQNVVQTAFARRRLASRKAVLRDEGIPMSRKAVLRDASLRRATCRRAKAVCATFCASCKILAPTHPNFA
ncbi:hypothetical protein FF2_026078 [Malus domestica]